jgi:hypothetical protein
VREVRVRLQVLPVSRPALVLCAAAWPANDITNVRNASLCEVLIQECACRVLSCREPLRAVAWSA